VNLPHAVGRAATSISARSRRIWPSIAPSRRRSRSVLGVRLAARSLPASASRLTTPRPRYMDLRGRGLTAATGVIAPSGTGGTAASPCRSGVLGRWLVVATGVHRPEREGRRPRRDLLQPELDAPWGRGTREKVGGEFRAIRLRPGRHFLDRTTWHRALRASSPT